MKYLYTSLIISMTIFFMGNMVKKKKIFSKEKNSPFECGFDPFSLSRCSFSLRFFMISIIFLIFDIEIVIILPLPLLSETLETPLVSNLMAILFLIFVGLIYEWKNGMIEWLK
uniref:NADH dehydrogenase subunit 3 n=1 Tax=Ornithodoros tartakovskyi TaxID=570969 RepID=UPI002238EDB4|nr:NADH dehydrogenase subunit 3 [Ornithodoros tartakovskyi]UYB78671.1 NADH dehydrogenase subunit 3 [Ornithodoros tartakovskyi]UYB78684.1 NADH dehydrogenase subunit 3 [Ornithodoros tartakovskyi]